MATIRTFKATDIGEIVKIWNKAMPYNPISHKFFVQSFVLDYNFDPNGFFVAEEGDEIVGFIYAIVRRFPVDVGGPAEDENGFINGIGLKYEKDVLTLGKELVKKAEEYFSSLGKTSIHVSKYTPQFVYQGINTKYESYVKLFNECGYSEELRSYARGIDLLNYVRPPEVDELKAQREKEGFIFTEMKDEYILPLFEVNSPGWRHRFRKLLIETMDYSKFTLAVYEGKVVGFTIFGDTYSSIERFGPYRVNEDFRGLGLGKIILHDCFAKMKEMGLQCAWAQYTPGPGFPAAHVYDKAGFTVTSEYIIFIKNK